MTTAPEAGPMDRPVMWQQTITEKANASKHRPWAKAIQLSDLQQLGEPRITRTEDCRRAIRKYAVF